MQVSRRIIFVLFVFGCLMTVQACGPNKYRLELETKGVSFTSDSFFKAVSAGSSDTIRLFILGGFNVNTCRELDGDIQTVMHAAILKKDMKLAAFLLDHGYDSNEETCGVKTPPLHLAAMRGLVDISKLLIERGADVNRKDRSGMTPLMLAQQMGRPVMENFLRAHGAK